MYPASGRRWGRNEWSRGRVIEPAAEDCSKHSLNRDGALTLFVRALSYKSTNEN